MRHAAPSGFLDDKRMPGNKAARDKTVNEEQVDWDDYEDHEVDWPAEVPEGSLVRRKG